MNESDDNAFRPDDGVPTMVPDAAVPASLGPGVRIGQFELQTLLGRGGMGEVWKAWDPRVPRPVVIKLVPREMQHATEAMVRVKTTFKLVHELHDRHICPLYLLDEDPRFGWYLVMKYIDGQTLSSYRATYVARHGSFPLEQVVKVLRPVADALDYAHERRVLHRDIKPQNILVVGDADDVLIVDFGLAAEIRTTVTYFSQVRMDTFGTRPYMAPKQWKSQYQDKATDQYGLAAVAYELLAGHLPFESDDFDILRACVLNDPPEPIVRMPDSVNRALLRGLAKRRDERFSSCVAFVQALHGTSTEERAETQRSTEAGRAHAFRSSIATQAKPVVKLIVTPEEALEKLHTIRHKKCVRAIKNNWRVDQNGIVSPSSVHWLFCWGKTGQNSDRAADDSRRVFDELFNLKFDEYDKLVDHDEARIGRYKR